VCGLILDTSFRTGQCGCGQLRRFSGADLAGLARCQRRRLLPSVPELSVCVRGLCGSLYTSCLCAPWVIVLGARFRAGWLAALFSSRLAAADHQVRRIFCDAANLVVASCVLIRHRVIAAHRTKIGGTFGVSFSSLSGGKNIVHTHDRGIRAAMPKVRGLSRSRHQGRRKLWANGQGIGDGYIVDCLSSPGRALGK
jgi:hypothetical protein